MTSVTESPQDYRRRKRIQEYLAANPDAAPSEILGALMLPLSARRIIAEIDARIDTSELVSFERGPVWRVKSVTVGDDEYPASAGNGVDMVDIYMPAERISRNALSV